MREGAAWGGALAGCLEGGEAAVPAWPLAPAGRGWPADPEERRVGRDLIRPAAPDEVPPGAVALIGVPFDAGVPGRPGARFGPEAVRAELARATAWYPDADLDLADGPPLLDLGDLQVVPGDVAATQERLERVVAAVAARGGLPLVVGGDHSLSVGTVRGLARVHGSLGLVQCDAHHDVRQPAGGFLSSGTPFRLLLEDPRRPLDARRVVQLGIAAWRNSAPHTAYARGKGVRVVTLEAVRRRGIAAAVAAAVRGTAGGPFAVSFDLDAVAAAHAPGVSAPGPCGLPAEEAREAVFHLALLPACVGMDLVECAPALDPEGRTARLAAELTLAFWTGRALARRLRQGSA